MKDHKEAVVLLETPFRPNVELIRKSLNDEPASMMDDIERTAVRIASNNRTAGRWAALWKRLAKIAVSTHDTTVEERDAARAELRQERVRSASLHAQLLVASGERDELARQSEVIKTLKRVRDRVTVEHGDERVATYRRVLEGYCEIFAVLEDHREPGPRDVFSPIEHGLTALGKMADDLVARAKVDGLEADDRGVLARAAGYVLLDHAGGRTTFATASSLVDR